MSTIRPERRDDSMRFFSQLRDSPSRALLFVQLVAVLLYPWFDDRVAGQLVVTAISVGVLSAAVWMVHKSPRAGWVAGLLAAAGIGFHVAFVLHGVRWVGVVGAAGYAIAYFYAAGALIGYMMSDENTSTDEMWAAGATFMLFVEAYAWIFSGVQLLQPGAYVVPGAGGRPLTWVELLFLSATNFSATGLSDIVPASAHARTLMVVAQWNGVMYLAVVVARLAGLLRRRGSS